MKNLTKTPINKEIKFYPRNEGSAPLTKLHKSPHPPSNKMNHHI